MKRIILLAFSVITLMLIINGCGITSPIKQYSESKSKFKNPTKLMSNNYPAEDIYWIYHRASTGFTSIQTIRESAYKRAEEFARQRGKKYIVLGEQISNPPYIMGNFQRIEIIFALTDGTSPPPSTKSKADKLRELKEMLDGKLITQDEYNKEKKKILDE